MASTLALPAQDRASDLDDPRCEIHERGATFVVETDGRDGPERALACDRCLPDVFRDAAMRSCSFPPPAVSALRLRDYQAWEVSA